MTPLVLMASALASAPAAASSCSDTSPLHLITANAWGLPPPVARHRRARMRRIERYLDRREPDITGVQEMWSGALKLLRAPLHTVDASGDSGLGIRSPHPVARVVEHTFVAERGLDAWKAKGVLTARVEVPTGPVDVAVTHLQSGRGVRNATVRAAQVEEVLEVLGPARPWVLMGDFNFYDAEPLDRASHLRLVEAGFLDAGLSGGAKRGTYPGLKDRFDRVYVRSPCAVHASAEVVDGGGLSDHHFVEVYIEL